MATDRLRMFVQVHVGRSWWLFGRHLLRLRPTSSVNGKMRWQEWRCVFCGRLHHQLTRRTDGN